MRLLLLGLTCQQELLLTVMRLLPLARVLLCCCRLLLPAPQLLMPRLRVAALALLGSPLLPSPQLHLLREGPLSPLFSPQEEQGEAEQQQPLVVALCLLGQQERLPLR